MNTNELLKKYTRFNVWANTLMCDWLTSKDGRLMDRELKSSFPTVNTTLAHIWFGEHIWFRRIHGERFENINLVCEGKPVTFISEGLLRQSMDFMEYTAALKAEDLDRMVEYRLFSGETDASPLADIIHHIMNHGTYHRGQLVTMGRELGFEEVPKTDFIHFCRQEKA